MVKKARKRRALHGQDRFSNHHNFNHRKAIQAINNYVALAKNERDRKIILMMKEAYLQKREIAKRRYLKKIRTYPALGSLQSKGSILLEIANSQYTLSKIARNAHLFYRKNYSLSKRFQSRVGKSKFRAKSKVRKPFDRGQQYSKKDLIKIISRYAGLAKTEKQQKYMDVFIDNYIDEERRKADMRKRRDNKIERRMDAPVYTYPIIRASAKMDKVLDDQERRRIISKAQRYYHQNYSLTKKYKEASGRTKPEDKDMTKE